MLADDVAKAGLLFRYATAPYEFEHRRSVVDLVQTAYQELRRPAFELAQPRRSRLWPPGQFSYRAAGIRARLWRLSRTRTDTDAYRRDMIVVAASIRDSSPPTRTTDGQHVRIAAALLHLVRDTLDGMGADPMLADERIDVCQYRYVAGSSLETARQFCLTSADSIADGRTPMAPVEQRAEFPDFRDWLVDQA